MDVYSIINTIVTIILGGGWFIHWRAGKRKANAEASQSEAEGWKAMQDLYQQTINDFKVYSEDMRNERTALKKENSEMRDKYKQVEEEILSLKRQLSRQGRKLEAISPFLCGAVGCLNRKKVVFGNLQTDGENNEEQEYDVNENK